MEDNMEYRCSMQFEEAYKRVGGHMYMHWTQKNELDQMIAIARTKLTSLVLPEPKMGWNREQGEEIAQGLHKKGYIVFKRSMVQW